MQHHSKNTNRVNNKNRPLLTLVVNYVLINWKMYTIFGVAATCWLAILVVLLCSYASNSLAQQAPILIDPTAPWAQNITRLPADVVPLNYDLILRPDLISGSFTGNVTILMSFTAPRSDIYLNVKSLNITFVELYTLSGSNTSETVVIDSTTAILVPLRLHFPFASNEMYILQLTGPAAVGRYALRMGFNGTMLGKLAGLYRSSYRAANNATRFLATTQFEMTDARQAFPCFDDPKFKSTFNITVEHSASLTALSNMPALRERVAFAGSGWNVVMTQFQKTAPMPTYLVAIIVCDFNFIETFSSDGVRIRVYATPEQISRNNAQLALLVANHSMSIFSVYFDIPYYLPKLDIVAIPDFWGENGMENWGLITVREYYGLFDPNESDEDMRIMVASLVAHEVAHQWCGNLVTADWWSQIWLNEGFAERMQYIGILNGDPDWDVTDMFVTDELQPALAADALAASHSVITTRWSDVDLFDTVTYSKGASLLRMLANIMGPEPFRLGVSRYLKSHFLGSVNTTDLWTALDQQLVDSGCVLNTSTTVASNNVNTFSFGSTTNANTAPTNEYGSGSQCMNVAQVMNTWTLQQNYPILHLESVNFTHGQVRQERFLFYSNKSYDINVFNDANTVFLNYSWFVPVTYQTLNSPKKQLTWLTPGPSAVFQWPQSSRLFTTRNSQLSLFNPGQTGFYRVNYPTQQWLALADRLLTNINFIPNARDRSGLLNDAFALARANIVAYSVPFRFLRYLRREPSLAVWKTLSKEVEFLSARLRATPEAYEIWRQIVRDLVRPVFQQLGWSDVGSSSQRRLRALLLNMACEHGDSDCIRNVRQLFFLWLQGSRIPPNLRPLVFKYGMRYADNDIDEQIVRNRFMAAIGRPPETSRLLLDALTSSSRPWQLLGTLRWAEDEDIVRRHDYLHVYRAMADNPVALPYAWLELRSNWPRLVDRFSNNDIDLSGLLPAYASQFNMQQQLDEMRVFFGQYPVAGAGLLHRMQAVEIVENNLAWLQRNNQTINLLLRDTRSLLQATR